MLTIQDQYTRPLVQSVELADTLRLFGRALAGKSGAERFATGLQLQEDLRKRPNGYVDALDRVDALRSDPEYVNRLAIGERSCCPPGPNTSPMCTLDGRRICDYDRVGDRDPGLAGNTAFSLSPQPAASFSWWRPKLIRFFAHDTTNPSIPRWEGLFVTLITVGAHPVEGFSTAPAAGVAAGVHAGDFVVPDNSGVPVGWPDFSNDANSNQLVFSGIGLWNAGITYSTYLTVMGNGMRVPGQECRVHPDSSPLPPPAGGAVPSSAYPGGRF
jgi:hypothetical protein